MVNENGQKKSVPRDEKLSYRNFIQAIFDRHHEEGEDSFDLKKTEIAKLASKFRASLPDNLEDLLSSFRFRADFPNPFARTATPNGMEWIVESRGESVYRFRLVTRTRFLPQKSLVVIDVPDLTPQIVTRYALRDEQILLAKMRHNRLVDTFLEITTHSLQSHLRTTIKSKSGSSDQVEIDELYVGIDTDGNQYVIPVQAKEGSHSLGSRRTQQVIDFCLQRFPDLICRPVSAQFLSDDAICLFELTIQHHEIRVKNERHYKLCAFDACESQSSMLRRAN